MAAASALLVRLSAVPAWGSMGLTKIMEMSRGRCDYELPWKRFDSQSVSICGDFMIYGYL